MKLLARFQYADAAFPVPPTSYNGQKYMSTINRSSTTYPQAPVNGIGGDSGFIKKIKIETNTNIVGRSEYDGLMEFILFKNNSQIWSSGGLAWADWPKFTANTTTIPQGTLWYDVNLPYVQADEFFGAVGCLAVVGGPLGIRMEVWGTTV